MACSACAKRRKALALKAKKISAPVKGVLGKINLSKWKSPK